MKLFSLYIFDEIGQCKYYYDFLKINMPPQQLSEHKQFVSGLIESITKLCTNLNPSNEPNTFECYNTDTYKFHYFQTPTNLRFVLFTEPSTTLCCTSWLKEYYSECYIEATSKNPLFNPEIIDVKCPLLDDLTKAFFIK
ncbi:Trafficking protein particle complex subunit [Entamoeba marina]